MPLSAQIIALVALSATLASAGTPNCPEECRQEECANAVKIRWGKYCGTKHGACAGQDPCDAVDECCRKQQQCTIGMGATEISCYEGFQECIAEAATDGKPLFSDACTKEKVIDVMHKGAEMAKHLADQLAGRTEHKGHQIMEELIKKRKEIIGDDEL